MQSLEIEYQNISKNQWLSQTDQFKSGTPSDYIIYKCLPGLGATHGELILYNHRNSIIVEPNVPVIEGKRDSLDELGEKLYPNMLAVYRMLIEHLSKHIWQITFIQRRSSVHQKLISKRSNQRLKRTQDLICMMTSLCY